MGKLVKSAILGVASYCQFDSDQRHHKQSPIAQLVELLPLKQEVQGSSPCGGTGKLEAPFDSGVRGVRCQSKEQRNIGKEPFKSEGVRCTLTSFLISSIRFSTGLL